ncbi:dispersed gene family protein 1 (DGF-1), putative, partial [Trypanosoma cruzi]
MARDGVRIVVQNVS